MASTPVSAPDEDDPLVTQFVEKALDLVRDKMPAEDLEVYRQRMYLFYETNPGAVDLLNQIREAKRQAPTVTESSEVDRRDDTALAAAVNRVRARKDGHGK
jgi:hypothetical protein